MPVRIDAYVVSKHGREYRYTALTLHETTLILSSGETQQRTQGGTGVCCPPPNGCMIVHNNKIIMPGEAILGAENSGSRGCSQRSPDPLLVGRGFLPLPKKPTCFITRHTL